MKIIIIVLLSIKVAYFFELNLTNRINEGFISNAKNYDAKKYPFVVSIVIPTFKENGEFLIAFCTGSLLSKLYVLTAAHCVYEMEKEDIKVFLGSKYDNIIQKVAETYIPKDYVDVTKNLDALITHDIAIIKLKNPFPKVKKFLEIGGKPEDFEDEKAIECTCIGFGAINKFGHMDFKGRIMTTNVTHGEEACEKHYSSAIKTNWKQYLCSTPGRLTMLCQGDSGGPMICNGKLYGVCSFFLNYKDLGRNICGGPDMQSVHTFIHFHLKWVNSVIKKKNSGNLVKPYLTLHAILTIFLLIVLNYVFLCV